MKTERKFTGWFIPVAQIKLFDGGLINSMELILLSNIDSLSNSEGKFEGYCFASNRHLAKQLHVSPRQIGSMLLHLEGLKLIQRKFMRKRRVIRVRRVLRRVANLA